MYWLNLIEPPLTRNTNVLNVGVLSFRNPGIKKKKRV